MARCTLVSTFRIILGVAQQRVETPDCVNYCSAPVMYLLNTDSPHVRPYIPCPQEMIHGMNTVGLYFSTVIRSSCSQNTWMKRMTIMSLFNQWSIDTFLAFHVCPIFPFFFENTTKVLAREKERRSARSFCHYRIYRALLSILLWIATYRQVRADQSLSKLIKKIYEDCERDTMVTHFTFLKD